MDKLIKRKAELEAIVLSKLRGTPGCEGARSVTIFTTGGRWELAHFNAGGSDTGLCGQVLKDIVPALRQLFDVGR